MNERQVLIISAIIIISVSLSVNMIFSNSDISEYRKKNIMESDRYLSEGITLYKLNFYGKAIEKLRKSIEYQPDYSLTHSMLGRNLQKIGEFNGAKEEFRRAIELNPESYVSRCEIASILIEEDSIKKADDILKKAMKINPNLPRAYNLLKSIESDIDTVK